MKAWRTIDVNPHSTLRAGLRPQVCPIGFGDCALTNDSALLLSCLFHSCMRNLTASLALPCETPWALIFRQNSACGFWFSIFLIFKTYYYDTS